MNKYRAKAITVDGERFDSQAEHRRWCELRLLERAEKIRGLERQYRIPLRCGNEPIKICSKGYPNGRRAVYVADFAYWERISANDWLQVYEDKKGMDTPVSRLKRAIVEAMYPGTKVRIT